MKISAISTSNYKVKHSMNSNNQNFKGIYKEKSSDYSSDSWHGQISGSSIDGYYSTEDSSYSYIYYPFKNESEAEIEKNIKAKNYSRSYDNCGCYCTETYNTERGKTLPYTEKEWQRLPKSIKEKFEQML